MSLFLGAKALFSAAKALCSEAMSLLSGAKALFSAAQVFMVMERLRGIIMIMMRQACDCSHDNDETGS